MFALITINRSIFIHKNALVKGFAYSLQSTFHAAVATAIGCKNASLRVEFTLVRSLILAFILPFSLVQNLTKLRGTSRRSACKQGFWKWLNTCHGVADPEVP